MHYSGTVSTEVIGASLRVLHYYPALGLCCVEIRAPSHNSGWNSRDIFALGLPQRVNLAEVYVHK